MLGEPLSHFVCPVLPEYASSPGLVGASLVAARRTLRPVANANASFFGIVGASLVAAHWKLCTVTNADASSPGNAGASFVVANFACLFRWHDSVACFGASRRLLMDMTLFPRILFLI